MMESTPVAAFVMTEAEFGFEFLVVAFDHPAAHGVGDQLLERDLLWQRG
ncbi:MAG: hypothetical protein JWN63_3312 [Candidatus Acidoferrum typicum]|nr:hypothetical protein [Candidatus Acidoferrum typicum]